MLDDGGTFDLVLVDQTNVRQYFKSADLAAAGRAASWSVPRAISYDRVGTATLTAGEDALYVAGTLIEHPFEVYFTKSNGTAALWSEPVPVSAAQSDNEIAGAASLTVGQDGVIHVVWPQNAWPGGYPPLGATIRARPMEAQVGRRLKGCRTEHMVCRLLLRARTIRRTLPTMARVELMEGIFTGPKTVDGRGVRASL